MKSHAPEERLALYVTGDLHATETASIREHLEACEDCRRVAGELERTCALLGSVSEEPEPESLAEVRSRVRNRIAPRKPHVWRWAAAAAVTAAICAVWFVEYQPEPPLPAPPQIAAVPPAPAPENFVGQTLSLRGAPGPALPRNPRHLPAPGIKSVALISQPKGPTLIKITTTDPHVLILLASDERTNIQ